ncbi:MAG: PPOX class F420-dependent oxidoreductase [Microlunatus sp.]|nr:PPOX class F420-dependent oxidoreductase [Microlunatus sp.]
MAELDDLARRLISGPNYAHLATLLPDGAPHSVPIWVDLEDDRIVFLTSPSSRKARNIAADPRVCLSVTDREQPFTAASIRGRVVGRIDGDAGWRIIDRIAEKYVGGPYDRGSERVIYLIEPDQVLSSSV